MQQRQQKQTLMGWWGMAKYKSNMKRPSPAKASARVRLLIKWFCKSFSNNFRMFTLQMSCFVFTITTLRPSSQGYTKDVGIHQRLVKETSLTKSFEIFSNILKYFEKCWKRLWNTLCKFRRMFSNMSKHSKGVLKHFERLWNMLCKFRRMFWNMSKHSEFV